MKFNDKLIKATFIKRYKRFFVDAEANGETLVAHCPNTGTMESCVAPGVDVYLSPSNDPKRKLKFTLEMSHNGETFIGLNTSKTNHIVKEALENKLVPEFSDYELIKPEAKILNSRLDFFLSNSPTQEDVYIEVKNVTLKKDGVAQFPDAVTTRGQKHLDDLIALKKQGHRVAMLYVVNREDVDQFKVCESIDPVYAEKFNEAYKEGVEILAYQTKLTEEEIILNKKIEVVF